MVRLVLWVAVMCGIGASGAWAQAPAAPAQAAAKDDTPSIRVGARIFTNYTYTSSPRSTDVDGNSFSPNSFNVARSYINITGNISHLVAFRITPDVARETSASSSLNGSLEFRLKYAFAQVNLDDWMASGTWVRLGIQQTPWLDYSESIYRYRFQGTLFAEREGYFRSSDAGASFHYNLPSSYGDLHVGVYNGEDYVKAETNNQKALMLRGTVRPFAKSNGVLRGLRATVFLDADHYVKAAERRRFIAHVGFQHKYLNAAAEVLDARDQRSVGLPRVDGHGYSVWVTPKSTIGLEGLLRMDYLEPDDRDNSSRRRIIAGLAYWFPHQGNVSSALLLDYDGQTFSGQSRPVPAQRRIALHALVNF